MIRPRWGRRRGICRVIASSLRPVRLPLDGREVVAKSWSEAFSCAVSRLVAVNPATFDALQAAGRLEWLGSSATVEAVSAMMDAGRINPQFADWGGGRSSPECSGCSLCAASGSTR